MSLRNRKILIILVIITSYLPVLTLWQPDLLEIPGYWRNLLGRSFGLVGLVLIAWQFILGVRPIIGKIIPDLMWVNKLHKAFGKYGFLVIIFHPVFLFMYYSDFGMNLFVPDWSTGFGRFKIIGQIALALFVLIWITSAIAHSRLSYRWWKKIHLVNYLALPLVLIHSKGIGVEIGGGGIWTYYWWIITILLTGFFFYRILFRLGLFRYKYVVTSVEKITQDVTKIFLQPVDLNKKLVPSPGQFVYIQTGLKEEIHPFTLSHFDDEKLAISAKNSGPFSKSIQNIAVGKMVYLDGPYGIFTYQLYNSNLPVVLIAGGIGITPFLKLIEHIGNGWDKPVWLFYANKTEDDIAYREYIEGISKVGRNFNVVNVISHQSGFIGEKGFISTELLQKYLDTDMSKFNFAICGSPAMLHSIRKNLIIHGVPKSQIDYELFTL